MPERYRVRIMPRPSKDIGGSGKMLVVRAVARGTINADGITGADRAGI